MSKTIQYTFFWFFFWGIVQAQVSNSTPNILFIAVDDLKPTIGVFGDELAHTPNINLLAQNAEFGKGFL